MKKIIFVMALITACSALFAVQATVVSVEGRVEMQDGPNWIKLEKG